MAGRRRAAAAASLILVACSVKEANRGVSGSGSREDDVREYVRLVVALGSRDPDSLDYDYSPRSLAEHDRATPPPLAAIRERARAAAERLDRSSLPDRTDEALRWRSLARQLRSVAARADLLAGKRLPFDQESESLFGITPPGLDAAGIQQTYRELERLLPGAGPLSARYAAFVTRHLVPPTRVRALFDRALEGCRARTLQHLSLPPEERVEVEPASDSRWSAFSRYRGRYRSTIQLNPDLSVTVDGVLALACHEGYPGHHAQSTLVEAHLVNEQRLLEFTVQPLFSPQMLVAEGLAVLAVDLAFPGAERSEFERDILYPLAGLDGRDAGRSVEIERLVDRLRPVTAEIARQYLDGDLEFVRAGAALRERALAPQPDELLKYLNEFRSYAVTYTDGPDWAGRLAGLAPNGGAMNWNRFETFVLRPFR